MAMHIKKSYVSSGHTFDPIYTEILEFRTEGDRDRAERIIRAAERWAETVKKSPTSAALANVEQALLAAVEGDE